jgi:hypothetical protein
VDEETFVDWAPAYIEHVWLAADLAILDVLLSGAGRFIDGGFVPFATTGALVLRIS